MKQYFYTKSKGKKSNNVKKNSKRVKKNSKRVKKNSKRSVKKRQVDGVKRGRDDEDIETNDVELKKRKVEEEEEKEKEKKRKFDEFDEFDEIETLIQSTKKMKLDDYKQMNSNLAQLHKERLMRHKLKLPEKIDTYPLDTYNIAIRK
jgi:hypothetical protein